MRRLYFKEDWTLEQLAAYYKVTKQAIYDKFTRNGIKLQRKKGKTLAVKKIDREILSELYEKERLPVLEIAARLKVCYGTVARELNRHGIERRLQGGRRRRYTAIHKLEIGEKLTVSRPSVKQPYSIFYYYARIAKIKISVKSIDNETLQITRIK
jgi:predicted DNA-binding protein YlxM (UPF0122 family)